MNDFQALNIHQLKNEAALLEFDSQVIYEQDELGIFLIGKSKFTPIICPLFLYIAEEG
jgi:hypothetical protein